jgi:hypothetical protein
MLHVIVMILALASVVLALLIMVQVISVKDLLSFTKRGLVTLVVLLVAGCLLKQLVVTLIAPVLLLPIAKASLLSSLVAVLAIIALFLIIRLLLVAADSRRNT